MDAYEATRIVFSRIQSLEPENVSKIIGYLLLQDHGEQEMIRLAFSPDSLIQSMIIKAKKDLGLMQQQGTPAPTVSSYLSRINRPPHLPLQSAQISQSRAFSSPTALSPHAAPWGSHISQQTRPLSNNFNSILNEIQTNTSTASTINSTSNGYLNFSLSPMPDQANSLPLVYNNEHPGLVEEFQLQDQLPFLNDSPESAKSHANYLSYPEMLQAYCNGNQPLSMDHLSPTAANNSYPGTTHLSKQSSSISDIYNLASESVAGSALAWKPCMYFARGYCKNGSNCRFLHGNYGGQVRSEISNDHTEKFMGSSSGPLEKLELELKELLRGRRSPVSVASLPQLYSERLGKALQAERFTRYRSDRDSSDHLASSASNSGSRQIYLTFPAESTFREEDVSNYFSIFGPVQDVRIPYQQKRMFGFVTFVYQETVKIILAKGNPHYVCDARVLVKPYKEKGSKPTERMKYTDCRVEYSGYMTTHNLDIKDSNLQLGPPRFVESSLELVTRRQLEEEQDQVEQAIELQTKLAELQLVDRKRPQLVPSDPQVSMTSTNSSPAHHYQNQFSNGPSIHSEEDATTSEDFNSSTLAEHFGYVLQVLDSESVYDERPKPVNHHHDRLPIANGAMRM